MSVTVNIQAAGGFSHYWSSFYNQLANSPIADGSDTEFVATDTGAFNGQASGLSFVVSGSGFAYSGSFPAVHLTGGTISAIEVRDAANNVLATFTGFDIPASALNSALATYVTGHGPTPGGDGQPDSSGFDAIFKAFNYNVTGYSGADQFEGGNLADTINGSEGADYIIGAGGADIMTGGLGNDVYVVDDAGDDVNENAGEGKDSVHAYISHTLAENVENLSLLGTALVGTGNELNNLMFGNFSANTIYGMGGDDYIDGGAGADIMIGGTGNENYVVDDSGDQIVEADNEGFEQVLSSVTYTLSANVENLNLQGNAAINGTGNDGYNELFGNSAANVLIGLGGDDFLSGGEGADTMIGGTGDDIYMRDNTGDIVVEDAGEGTDRVYSTVSYTLSANIENLTLTKGNLTGEGNELNNEIIGYYGGYTLMGYGGNDTLWGQVGADTMIGGTGDDYYYVEVAGDNVIENAGEGTDTVHTYINHTLAANVENLEMQYAGHLTGNGNALNNKITGNGNNNVIDGGAGDDTMIGGQGSDAYFVDSSFDVIIENAGEGTDAAYASATYQLGANIEHLYLQGTSNISGYGNALNNYIVGNSGNNAIDGGAGNDTMVGGQGSDAYLVDSSFDVIVESANEGTDAAYASATYQIGANIEHLYLQGTSNISGYGNALNNYIVGNSGNNAIDGRAGNDTMVGGQGSDAYFVDSSFDVIVENANEGSDAVYASMTYQLGANVEHLYLQGTSNISGYGNALNNYIVGNSGNNAIEGGVGADVMIGGAGSDAYFVDTAGDQVIENANEGTDAVYASMNYMLGANVEQLLLQGSDNLAGTGNSLSNYIQGNSGDNIIDGRAGADALVGGLGNDTLVFRAGEANGDIVGDFSGNGAALGDSLQLSGFGSTADGATFTQINATQWQIHSGLDGHNEIVTFSNAAAIHASDYVFL